MRRSTLIFLFGLLLAGGQVVQSQPSPDFGFTLGVNVTTLDAPGDVGLRQMAAGGLVAQLPVTGPLSVQSQLLLSQTGAQMGGEGGSIRYGAGYINVPLLLRVKLPSLGPVTPHGLAGGFGGLKIFEQQRAGGDLSLSLPDTGTSFFRRTNGGVMGGVSGVISLGNGRRLNLAVRYEHGLVDVARSVADQPYDSAPFPATAQTRTWSIMLQFGL